MLEKTRAIILHTMKYGDSSLIVHAFTEKLGRKSFLLKGIRKSKKSARATLFQPLYLLDLDIYYRENREMHWIREASFTHEGVPVAANVYKSAQAIFISEVLMRTIREEEKNLELYRFLSGTLGYFSRSDRVISSFHLLFLFQLTRYLGFYPQYNYSSKNIFFNIESGSFSPFPGSAEVDLEAQLGKHWNACFKADYESIDQVFINHEQRNLFLDTLLGFFRFHHHSLGELKSLEVLRTVFG